jgi:hypothetical protein
MIYMVVKDGHRIIASYNRNRLEIASDFKDIIPYESKYEKGVDRHQSEPIPFKNRL